MSPKSAWLDAVKDNWRVADVAVQILGMRVSKAGMGPCPACQADKRGSEDKRPPMGVHQDGGGWHCHACNARGDVMDLVALHVVGSTCTSLTGEQWKDLRTWCDDKGLSLAFEQGGEARGAIKRGVRKASAYIGGGRAPAPTGGGRHKPPSERKAAPEQEQTDPQKVAPRGGMFAWDPDAPARCVEALNGDTRAAQLARAYLFEHRKITEDVAHEYGIGLYVNEHGKIWQTDNRPWLVIPLRDENNEVVNLKFRAVPIVGSCEHCQSPLGCKKCKSYRHCEGCPLPLFGSNTLRELTPNDTVHVVEGEFDVISAAVYGYQVGVVSGTAGAGTWKDTWLDLLEPFSGFNGMMDNDERGDEGWAKFVEKMGSDRCSRTRLPHKDLGDCLQADVPAAEIIKAMQSAEPMVGVSVKRIDHYTSAVETLIDNPEALKGVTTGSGFLDRLLGGIRPELIVVSGETGEGKTTFTTWLMWQLASYGYPCAIAPLEQSPVGDVQKLLRMEVGGNFLDCTVEERRIAFARLAKLPLFMLDYDGHMSMEMCVDIIRYIRRRMGVKFVVVDHLHFVVDPSVEDKTGAIEDVIRKFALLVKELEMCIILIAHPKNTQKDQRGQRQRVTAYDLKGASAIRQDAGSVLIVEKVAPAKRSGKSDTDSATWPRSRIHADKIRSEFGISGGNATLAFDPYSCIYADTWEGTPSGAQQRTLVMPETG